MRTKQYIELALETERLHRYVFDTLYAQRYDITDEDEIVLKKYKELCKQCPDFRITLWESHLRTGELKHINFNRYGFREETIK